MNPEAKDTRQQPKLQSVELTMQEIWQATRSTAHRSKKQYTRKHKHKKIND
jgi:hypothetical protein